MLQLLHLFRPKGSTHACVNTSRILQSVRRLASIPVIDVSSLVKPAAQQTYGDTDKQIAAGHQLCKAARQIGFFYVENSGISQTLTDDVLNRSKAWFDLPKAIKHEIVMSPERHYRGYQALGSNVNRRERGYNRDQHEALDFYKEVSPDTQPPSPIHGANQWPTHVPGLKPLLQEYVDRMLQLGRGVMSGIALGLGEPERLPGEPRMSEDSYWGMRLIHYPPLIEGDSQGRLSDRCPDAGRSVGITCGEHCDDGLLTFVNQQQGVTALQVKTREGVWIDVPPKPGTFICNTGDMLRIMTNGAFEPRAHRVVNNNSDQSRMSAAFFYEPAFSSNVRPSDHQLRPEGPKLESRKYGDHLERKVLANFELQR